MKPTPDHGEESYVGSGCLTDKKAIITGADSGIGKAVATAYAREGADGLISYLDEHEDARDTGRWVEDVGGKVVLLAGDLTDPADCREVIATAVEQLASIQDNAAFHSAASCRAHLEPWANGGHGRGCRWLRQQ
jgi:NAD(P)-dependent dehydrogenase (short-subunit alcohol dehydrogenase family)